MARVSKTDKVPLHLQVSKQARERIVELQRMSESESMSEVVRRALALYEIALRNRQDGGRLLLEEGGERREIILL